MDLPDGLRILNHKIEQKEIELAKLRRDQNEIVFKLLEGLNGKDREGKTV